MKLTGMAALMSDALERPYTVLIEPSVEIDLVDISWRIFQDRGADASEEYERKLRQTILALADMPHTGNVDPHPMGPRRYSPNHDARYNIWFLVDDEERVVSVRCLHPKGNRPPSSRFR